MPDPNLQLEDLLSLADTLRDAGFAIGTQQYIAAHELVLTLTTRGQLPDDPTKWRTLLGPVFCSSSREQAEFATHFANWLARRPALQQAVATAQPAPDQPTNSPETRRQWNLQRLLAAAWRIGKRPVVWGSGMVLIALLAVAGWYLYAKTERELTGKVISEATSQPLAGATVTFLDTKQQTDAQGEFRFSYQIRNYERWQSDKIEGILVEHPEHDLATRTIVTKSPARQEITLPKTSKPVTTFTPPPLPPAIEPQTTPLTQPNTRRLWPAAIPMVLYALWLLWRWWRRRLILQKLETSGTPRLQQLKLARDGVKLFDAPAFRRAVVELRRHRHVEANDLDVAATVRATIQQGGLLTPSFGRRRTLPEYLLLIDRASLHDEQARVGEALAARLQAGEIGLERFYFQGDARACRGAGPFAPTVTLNELAARFPEHRLLVFGDGAGFFDAFSGMPHRWLEQFAHWTERAVITPAAPDVWGYREETLQDHDFLLLPASAEGFEVLTAWLNTGLQTEARRQSAQPFPPMVSERPKRWLERVPPQPHVAAELIAQLKRYLDDEGWLWLRACAVYPQATWELTLYLGARLLGASAQTDWAERVLQLVRLPWFRYGTMPDWLRAELLAQLAAEPQQEARVRGVIADLLEHELTKPGEEIPLEIAIAPEQEPRGWRKWQAQLKQWWHRRKLYRLLQAQPEDSLLRDYVFLRFLSGQRQKPLTVQAPQWWQRLLFADGQRAMGLHPVTMGVLALLAALGLFWMFWLQPIIDDRVLTAPEPDITPTPLPTVPPDVPMTQPATPTPSPSPTPKPSVSPSTSPSPSPNGTLAGQNGGTGTEQSGVPPALTVKGDWALTPMAGGYRVEMGKGVAMNLRVLSGGAFTMGSNNYDDEKPPHRVQVSPFWMGQTEVTQAQWQAVMENNPSYFKGDDLPVEQVSWEESNEYCKRLSAKTGVQFRLPTEAEWEYAARAGTTTEYSFGDDAKQLDAYAWYGSNADAKTHPVGKKLPNPWGLYDMHGNVWEWCQDWYGNYPSGDQLNPTGPRSGQYRVLRGGSWLNYVNFCRSANRNYYAPGVRLNIIGFRVVVAARTP